MVYADGGGHDSNKKEYGNHPYSSFSHEENLKEGAS
jgi:hypothetical protein